VLIAAKLDDGEEGKRRKKKNIILEILGEKKLALS
jgi:hypothetical protein